MATNFPKTGQHGQQQQFKIVLLGEGCVGKTSLVLRYVENKFSETNQSTLQASFLTKNIYVQNIPITLNIWDTAGQERFHAVGPLYYRDSNGALLVYDVTDPDSLAKVKVWIKELRKVLGNDVCITIVGNKIDLLSNNEQELMNNNLIMEAQSYATTANATHYCTSAKTNYGIDDVFLDLTKRMIKFNEAQQQLNSRSLNSTATRGISIAADSDINEMNETKRRCC